MIRQPLHDLLMQRLREPKCFIQLLVGGQGIGVEDFLSKPAAHWLS